MVMRCFTLLHLFYNDVKFLGKSLGGSIIEDTNDFIFEKAKWEKYYALLIIVLRGPG